MLHLLLVICLAAPFWSSLAEADMRIRVRQADAPRTDVSHLTRRAVGTPAGGKKGMGIGEIEKLIPYTNKIGWVYNWEFDLDGNTLPPNMQYIPQL